MTSSRFGVVFALAMLFGCMVSLPGCGPAYVIATGDLAASIRGDVETSRNHDYYVRLLRKYQPGAEQGDGKSEMIVAFVYATGGWSWAPELEDNPKANLWIEKAVSQSYPPALAYQGCNLSRSKDVEQQRLAVIYLEQASAANDSLGKTELANILWNGNQNIALLADRARALNLYIQASRGRDIGAVDTLARLKLPDLPSDVQAMVDQWRTDRPTWIFAGCLRETASQYGHTL
jgi:hypothetical protein